MHLDREKSVTFLIFKVSDWSDESISSSIKPFATDSRLTELQHKVVFTVYVMGPSISVDIKDITLCPLVCPWKQLRNRLNLVNLILE